MARRIVAWVLGLLIAALYASAVITALGNLRGIPEMASFFGASVPATGWFWLWFGVVMPILVFGIALVLGHRRRAASRLLLLVAGLCLVSAIQLEVLHFVPQSSFFV